MGRLQLLVRRASRVALRLDRLKILSVLALVRVDGGSVRGSMIRESLHVVDLERLERRCVVAGEGGDGHGVLLEEGCEGVRVLVLQSLARGVGFRSVTLHQEQSDGSRCERERTNLRQRSEHDGMLRHQSRQRSLVRSFESLDRLLTLVR